MLLFLFAVDFEMFLVSSFDYSYFSVHCLHCIRVCWLWLMRGGVYDFNRLRITCSLTQNLACSRVFDLAGRNKRNAWMSFAFYFSQGFKYSGSGLFWSSRDLGGIKHCLV